MMVNYPESEINPIVHYLNSKQLKKILYLKAIFVFWKVRSSQAQLNQVAASLAYTTVLAVVPMLSIATILIGQLPQFVNLRESIQVWLTATLIPGFMSDTVSPYLTKFSNQSKGLTLFGLAGLLFSVFLTLMTIEKSFNQVWQVKQKRPFPKRIIAYVLATTLGPLFLGISVYLTSLIISATHNLKLGFEHHLGVIDVVFPFILTCLPFILLYRFGPSVVVALKDAMIGGVVAAAVFEFTKYAFTIFISQMPIYKTLYGAFAIVPLFLVWIYLTWWVTMAGAVLTASLPQIRHHLGFTD